MAAKREAPADVEGGGARIDGDPLAESTQPIVDQWYLRDDTGERFVVTGYDEETGSVEIQTAEGDVDELDEEVWRSTRIRPVEPSQDWTESMDSELADDDELKDDRLDSEGGAEPVESLPAVSEPDVLERLDEPPQAEDESEG
jgi:hypothetical protein